MARRLYIIGTEATGVAGGVRAPLPLLGVDVRRSQRSARAPQGAETGVVYGGREAAVLLLGRERPAARPHEIDGLAGEDLHRLG